MRRRRLPHHQNLVNSSSKWERVEPVDRAQPDVVEELPPVSAYERPGVEPLASHVHTPQSMMCEPLPPPNGVDVRRDLLEHYQLPPVANVETAPSDLAAAAERHADLHRASICVFLNHIQAPQGHREMTAHTVLSVASEMRRSDQGPNRR